MERHKEYVNVLAEFDTKGGILPVAITWADGTKYEIDRVIDKQRRAAMRVGGSGIRYHIRVVWDTPEGDPASGESYIYMEDDGRWFVEAKN